MEFAVHFRETYVAFAPGSGKKLGPKTTRYEVVIHGRYKAEDLLWFL